jgi:hypothetical protein
VTELIFMLTRDDRTVANAREAYGQVRHLPLGMVGFKDVGATPAVLRELTHVIQADGRRAVLEVVAPDPNREMAAVRAGLDLGVDMLMGGLHTRSTLPLLAGAGVEYLPFPGQVVGHPSELTGSIDEIVADGRALASRPEVTGLDLLAWRWTDGDGADLTRAVVDAVDVPVVVAGSIDSIERVEAVARSGAWAFTVGSAAFAGRFAEGGLASQLETVLSIPAAPS